MAEVLIFSSRRDEVCCEPVRSRLAELGIETLQVNTDDVLDGSTKVRMAEGQETSALEINGKCIDREYCAAWIRRPFGKIEMPEYFGSQDHRLRQDLQDEVKVAITGLITSIPNTRFLNSLDSTRIAERKSLQLRMAKKVGLNIPDTEETNFINECSLVSAIDRVVFKPHRGISTQDGRSSYTSMVDSGRATSYNNSLVYPGIFQEFVDKQREWRVTIVGDEHFAVTIETKEVAKDDWRKHQFERDLVEFAKGNLPEEIITACTKLMGELDLKYGAFDFIEKPSGEFVFLEINPSGQYMWLENMLGLDISGAIARTLIQILERSVE